MARRMVPCTSCAATWTDKRARFCGLCGASLPGFGDLPSGTDNRTARRRARLRLTAVAAAGAAVAVLLGVAAFTDVLSMPQRGDPEVALPTPDVLPTGSRLAPDEALALRQQVDPNRLRCEPRGCELWRRSLSRDPGLTGEPTLTGLGDLVVLLEDTRVVGLDGRTGEARWIEPLDDLLPAGATSARFGPSEWLLLSPLEDAVLVGVPGHVVLVGDDGMRRWVASAPSQSLWGGEVHEGLVLLHAERAGTSIMMAIDLDDGSIVWQRDDGYHHAYLQDGHVLVSSSRRVEVVDVTDGQLVWSHDFGTDSTMFEGAHSDVWLAGSTAVVVHSDASEVAAFDMVEGQLLWSREFDASAWPMMAETWIGVPDPDSSEVALVELATGRDIASFANATVSDWLEIDDLSVLLLSPHGVAPDRGDDQHQGATRLVAIGLDGEVVWQFAVELTRRCCAWLGRDEPGVVAVVTDDDTTGLRAPLRVEVATGTPLDVSPDSGDLAFHSGWQAADGTRVEWETQHVTLRKDDHSVRVFPGNTWPQLEGPWVFASNGELIGVQLMPDG